MYGQRQCSFSLFDMHTKKRNDAHKMFALCYLGFKLCTYQLTLKPNEIKRNLKYENNARSFYHIFYLFFIGADDFE